MRRLPLTPLTAVLAWMAFVTLIAAVGAAGYVVIDNWPWFEAVYMSVITLATVGFGEVRPLSRAGRVWTMFLAVAGVAIIFGTVGIAVEVAVTWVGSGTWRRRAMERRIGQGSGHYLVCGFGRVGSRVSQELPAAGKQVVVLDSDEKSRARAETAGFDVVHGDATSDAVLMAAGVDRAAGLVAAVDSDANNVYVTLAARALNPELFIVGRASQREVVDKLTKAGADRAISPYSMAGRRIANLVMRPGVVDFVESAMSSNEHDFSIEEVRVSERSRIAGLTVRELRHRGVHVLAIRREDGSFEPHPPDDRRIDGGVQLIVSGTIERLAAVEQPD